MVNCKGPNDVNFAYAALRIASIIIILITSFGALLPIVTQRQRVRRLIIPETVLQVAKYFDSGVYVQPY